MKRGTPDHPKVKQLADLLHIEIWGAVGVLEMLWHFTAKFAPQGDIGRYSDEVIAEAVHWRVRSGSAGVPTGVRLRSALVQAGFLDTCPINRLVVHDWKDHADEGVKKFLSRHSLDFVQTQSSKPEPQPLPRPQPSPLSRQTAAAASPASPPANGIDAILNDAIESLAAEGVPLPPRYLTNEYGRTDRNPAHAHLEDLLRSKQEKILRARKPQALARKIILDELHGA